ncbi:MAG TPA: hypothetical protein VFK02_33440 [Kofleriaceae bacterium]|nr:hypothetical protein [Kofleriaceae bacterium]
MRWLPWLVVAACSGGSGSPPARRPISPPAAPAPAEAGPSERECDELITHAVALGVDEQAAGAAEPRTTAADHEAVRRQLHDDFLTGCRALPREAYRCAIAATSLTGLAGCQPSASSSTSNRSVAPGGMTPPAPRSP